MRQHSRRYCGELEGPARYVAADVITASDGDLDAELSDSAAVSCPYCGESSELLVDLVGGAVQEYVEDCQVCCRPWLVRIQLDGEGHASVSVTTLYDE